MNNREINLNADKVSFWKFINDNKIVVPPYQREYVQGRRFGDANKKRRDFINDIYDALKTRTEISLDFIYGGNENNDSENNDNEIDEFYPVDGQQRLTLLFLLHWYIFERTKSYDCIGKLGNFSYSTRTTSKTFCENLISVTNKNTPENTGANSIDFSLEYRTKQLESQGRIVDSADEMHEQDYDVLFEQFKNLPWFTGNMESDPTVSSMLIVLDCIHRFFLNESEDELNEFKELLTKSDIISFLALDMNDALGSGPQIRDLYIKMNARGKQLSDFDDFKAELQKVKTGLHYDLLGDYLKQKATCTRQELIGKLNTDYSDLFFSIIDNSCIDGNPRFEDALMNYYNEMIRTEFLIASKEVGFDQKTYRDFNKIIKALSGHSFECFIEERGEPILKDEKEKHSSIVANLKEKEWALYGFERSASILDELLNAKDSLTIKGAYNENFVLDLIKKLGNEPEIIDNIERSAIFDYIIHDTSWNTRDSFAYYCNFIVRLIENTNVKDANVIPEIICGTRKMIKNLNSDYSKGTLIKAISELNTDDFSSRAKLQLEEEILRAKLIRINSDWENELRKAESMTKTRQVWFLLEMSSNRFMSDISRYLSGEIDEIQPLRNAEDINLETFIQISSKCNCFANNKNWNLVDNIDINLFEVALMVASNNRRYGQKMNKSVINSFKLHNEYDNDYSHLFEHADYDSEQSKNYDFYQHIIGLSLLYRIIGDGLYVSNDTLGSYINAFEANKNPEWKTLFIISSIFNVSDNTVSGFNFKKTYSALEKEPNALLFDTENRRNDAMDIHTFFLAKKLKSLGYEEIETFSIKDCDDDSKAIYSSLDGFEFWDEDNIFSLYGIEINGVRLAYIPNSNPGYYKELPDGSFEFVQKFDLGNIDEITSIIDKTPQAK